MKKSILWMNQRSPGVRSKKSQSILRNYCHGVSLTGSWSCDEASSLDAWTMVVAPKAGVFDSIVILASRRTANSAPAVKGLNCAAYKDTQEWVRSSRQCCCGKSYASFTPRYQALGNVMFNTRGKVLLWPFSQQWTAQHRNPKRC